MRFVIYVKTGNTESLLYDSEAGSQEYFIGDPKLRIELNKAGAFTFTILPSHPLYNSFLRMRTYVRILLDDEEIYRGRVIQIDDSTWMERSIQCEGDLAYLNDSIQYPDQTESTTQNSDIVTNNNAARDRITDAEQKKKMPSESITIARVNLSAKNANHESIQNHFIRFLTVHSSQMNTPRDFGIGNITVDDKDTVQDFTSTNYRDTLSAIEDDLLKYYGGFLQTRRSGDIVYLDWLKTPGGNATQPIKMGMNLIDIQQQASDMNAFSRLIPVGDNQLTIESVNDNKNYIQNDSVYNKYGAIYKTESFSDVTTAAELKRQARAWMKKNCKDEPISLTVEAIDMHLLDGSIEAIKLGTRVNVVSEPHGISLNLYVTSIEYDIQNPENNTYEIGDPYETLSQKTKKKKQSTEKSISSASTSAKSASRRAGNLEQAVNRHAQTISDVATGLYNIQADTLNISAKVVTIEADELNLKGKVTTIEGDLLDIHTKALKIDGERVEITADYAIIGNIIMGASKEEPEDYSMYLIGNTMLSGNLDVGGNFSCSTITVNPEDENGGLYINGERVNIIDIEKDTQNPNILHIYKADGTQIDFSKATTLSGVWSGSLSDQGGKKLTVKTDDPQGPSYVVQFEGTYSATRTNLEVGIGGSISIETVMGAKMLSIPVNVSRLTGTSSEPDIVYQTNISAAYNALLTPLEVTTNGTYNLADDPDHIGYSYVNVSTPMYIVYDPAYDDGYGSEKKVVRTSTTGSGYLQFSLYNSGTPKSTQIYDGRERITVPANTRVLRFKCGMSVVEELQLTDYKLGWDAASDTVVVPTTENLTSSISVTVPATTLYVPTVSYSYDLSADYNHAYLKLEDVIVAQADVPVTTVSADKGSMIDGQWEADTWSSANKMTVRLFKNGTQVSGGFVVDASGIVSDAVKAVTVTYDKGTMKDGEWLPDTWSSGNKMTVRLYKSGSQVNSFEVDASGIVSGAVNAVTVSADKGSMIDGQWEADTWSSANKMTVRLFKNGTQVSGGFVVDASGIYNNGFNAVDSPTFILPDVLEINEGRATTIPITASVANKTTGAARTTTQNFSLERNTYTNSNNVKNVVCVNLIDKADANKVYGRISVATYWNQGARTAWLWRLNSSNKWVKLTGSETIAGGQTLRVRYTDAAHEDANVPDAIFYTSNDSGGGGGGDSYSNDMYIKCTNKVQTYPGSTLYNYTFTCDGANSSLTTVGASLHVHW